MDWDWILTLVGLFVGIALFIFASWQASKPVEDFRPRLIPWRFITILSGFWMFLMLIHIFNLLGLETGPDKSPFMRRF